MANTPLPEVWLGGPVPGVPPLPHLTVIVVPDSGTGELEGLAGTTMITIGDGKHSYEMQNTLGGKP